MKREKKIKATLGIPADEDVYAVIVIGYPVMTFQRPAGRKANIVCYFESPS